MSTQELDANLVELTGSFEAATDAKMSCQQEADSTAETIILAKWLSLLATSICEGYLKVT